MRLHERAFTAVLRPHGDLFELVAPTPARFRSRLQAGDLVQGGTLLGELEILGQLARVFAPEGAHGVVVASHDLARRPVDHGGVLYALDPRIAADATTSSTTTAATTELGLVFRAPTSGRFYGRPSPDKPAFVSVGAELSPGTTICLLEVMKTFHRVTFGGAGLPDRARVIQLLVADGADVNAGDALLALEAI